MEKAVKVDQVEIQASGVIGVRMRKSVMDGEVEITREWHRTVIEPGADPEAQLAAVNAHLAAMSPAWPPVADWSDVRGAVALKHTPEFVAAWKAAQAAAGEGA